MTKRKSRQGAKLVSSIFFFLVLLAAGLLSGTQSTLVLSRDGSGTVTAVNAWRFAGRLPLLWRSAADVRDVRVQERRLSQADERSTASRDVWGMLTRQEELVIVGTTQLPYPYREDISFLRSFLKNPANRRAELRHPIDIRREVASVVLLTLAGLTILGFIWQRATGRAALAGAPGRVKPLPPALGAAVFLGAIVCLVWFFGAGHRVFGPLATKKVSLLLSAAAKDDTAGVGEAVRRGVFLDARDDQGRTALMLAARAGAGKAVASLLEAGANPSLRDMEDRTALMIAIQAEHVGIAIQLLDAASDVEAADLNGRTALHFAAELEDASLLQRLLALGCDVDRRDAHGWTPVFFAAAAGGAEPVRSLLAAGADARRKLPDGRRAADLASADPAVAALLAAAQAVKKPVEAPSVRPANGP